MLSGILLTFVYPFCTCIKREKATRVPITALEEPEAHLHPSAIRSLMSIVNDLPSQKLVALRGWAENAPAKEQPKLLGWNWNVLACLNPVILPVFPCDF